MFIPIFLSCQNWESKRKETQTLAVWRESLCRKSLADSYALEPSGERGARLSAPSSLLCPIIRRILGNAIPGGARGDPPLSKCLSVTSVIPGGRSRWTVQMNNSIKMNNFHGNLAST